MKVYKIMAKMGSNLVGVSEKVCFSVGRCWKSKTSNHFLSSLGLRDSLEIVRKLEFELGPTYEIHIIKIKISRYKEIEY